MRPGELTSISSAELVGRPGRARWVAAVTLFSQGATLRGQRLTEKQQLPQIAGQSPAGFRDPALLSGISASSSPASGEKVGDLKSLALTMHEGTLAEQRTLEEPRHSTGGDRTYPDGVVGPRAIQDGRRQCPKLSAKSVLSSLSLFVCFLQILEHPQAA